MIALLLACATIHIPFPIVYVLPDEAELYKQNSIPIVQVTTPAISRFTGGYLGDINSQLSIPVVKEATAIYRGIRQIDRRLARIQCEYFDRVNTREMRCFYMLNSRAIKFDIYWYHWMHLYKYNDLIFGELVHEDYFKKYFGEKWNLTFLDDLHSILITCKVCKSLGIDCERYEKMAEYRFVYLDALVNWVEKHRPKTAIPFRIISEEFRKI